MKTALLVMVTMMALAVDGRRCAYTQQLGADYSESLADEDDEEGGERLSPTLDRLGRVQLCPSPHDACYAFWTESGQVRRGCWKTSDANDKCANADCRSETWSSKLKRDMRFCCCTGDMCNLSPSSMPLLPDTPVPMIDSPTGGPVLVESSTVQFGPVAIIAGASLTGIIIVIFFVYKFTTRTRKSGIEGNVGDLETGGPGFSCSTTCVDNLKLHDNIGSGRHVKVWRGSLGGIPVAVKALPSTQTALWAHERDLYCLPHMKHPNLLQYFGCDTRPTLEGPPEHLLVLQLAPLGSLRNYLIENTLDWDAYTNMSLGVASALAYLHTGFEKDGLLKPSIVHRDVNSSNIVVRADLTCCLADLGLALPLPDDKSNIVHTQYRIQEAGTLRYLAPEALEGSLDLRRCGASLCAIDVYALSLVLWELLSRCHVLHRTPGPPPYALPYHAEIGDQLTLERMQVIVAKRKARPLFSTRMLPLRATRLARDTCEDCWDHDAEARLTAVCVVERLNELKNMRPAPSPTINSNDLRPSTQNQDSHFQNSVLCEDKNSNINSSTSANGNISNLIDLQANIMNKQPLQPHQGRNPCLERNLASVGEDELLIDKSLKDMPSNSSVEYGTNFIRNEQQPHVEQNYRNIAQDFSRPEEHNMHTRGASRPYSNQNSSANQANLSDYFGNPDDQTLNEFRQLTRPVTPIGYVQNDVSGNVNGIATSNSDTNPYGYPAKVSNINIIQDTNRSRWGSGPLKKLLDLKLFRKKDSSHPPTPLETEVNFVLLNGKPINNGYHNSNSGKFKTSIIVNDSRINRDNQNDNCTDRPSSLPGLDSVDSNGTVLTDCSSEGSQNSGLYVNTEILPKKTVLENNICLLSPPNRTISKDDRQRPDQVIVGFREIPTFDANTNQGGTNTNSSSQVFAVIVPKSSYSNATGIPMVKSEECKQKTRNEIDCSTSNNNCEIKHTYESKRFSCDGKILTSLADGSSEIYKLNGEHKTKQQLPYDRNSYSGEYDYFCKYNNERTTEESNAGYSSNSEDEHMLLLSENGGSKITMRQRYDIKPSQDNKSHRKNQTTVSSASIQECGSNISKIATDSFSNMCNKYSNRNKYENLQNEPQDGKSDTFEKNTPSGKDVTYIRNKKLSLSICNSNIENCDESDEISGKSENFSDKTENISSDEDMSYPDEVFVKKANPFRPLSIKRNLSRQHSLELVNELFSSSADLTRLKDPANRIKTPGDVPPSVRKMRGSVGSSRIRRKGSAKEPSKTSNRLSLYDDRMMFGNSL